MFLFFIFGFGFKAFFAGDFYVTVIDFNLFVRFNVYLVNVFRYFFLNSILVNSYNILYFVNSKYRLKKELFRSFKKQQVDIKISLLLI